MKESLLSDLTIGPGTPFSAVEIRENLKRIYGAGDFSQVYVEAGQAQGGLKLIFCPVASLRVSSVEISGNRTLSVEEIAPGQILGPGDKFNQGKLQKLQEHIQSLYQERGFYNVKITPIPKANAATRTVEVRLEVVEGAPSQIGQITFTGNTVFTGATLRDELDMERGATYDKSKLERGFRRIRDLYLREGYLLAKVSELEKSFDAASQRVNLTLQVLEGEKVEFRANGETMRPDKILKKEILNRVQSYDRSELRDLAREVRNYYKNKGYYLAEASFNETEREGRKVIVFSIDKKNKVAIKEIRFQGNQAFSEETLKDLMATKARSFFSRGRPDEERFREDLRIIKNFYLRHGYLDAMVKLEPVRFSEDQTWAFVTISISEGIQSLVKGIEFRGHTLFTSEELLDSIPLKLNTPLNPDQVRDSATTLQSLYARKGHIKARVEPDIEFNSDKRTAIVIFSITEGATYYIGNITLEGIVNTRKKLVERELLVHEGDLYDPEKIRRTVRNLLRLGIYDRVRFEPEDPESDEPIQDMILSVREAKAKSVEFALGYSTETQLSGSVELSDRNFLGYGGRGSFRVTGGFETFRVLVNYLQPHFFDRQLSLVANLFDDLDATMTSFDIHRRGGSLALDYEFSEVTKVALGYNFTHADLSSVRADAILNPTLDTGALDVGRLTFRISRDSRNNLLNPTRGSFHVAQIDTALEFLNSETDFIKVTGQTSWYFPFLRRDVLAFSLRGGLAEPLSGSPGIPIFERFFAGGDNTIRGFEFEKVGPLGTGGSPIGGDVSLIFNGELRFPLYKFIGGVLFFDAGNVWLRDRDLDLTDLRYTAGAGIRLSSPVGLFRIEHGFKLNRSPGESSGAWHISIGLPF